MAIVTMAAAAAGAVAGEKLIEHVVEDLYTTVKSAVGNQAKLWSVRKAARHLSKHVTKICQVKTLWQVDKAVDLRDFYCDTRIDIGKTRVVVHDLSSLGDRRCVLITGIAGQGKSILLRFLCSKALLSGDSIPVFIELRRVLSGDSLTNQIVQYLQVIGISDIDEPLLHKLLETGKIVLFLDGFDEVSESDKPKIVLEIEYLALYHERLRIAVTSRPESGFEASPLFEVLCLSNLQDAEYKPVIRKLSETGSFAENLIRQVESHQSGLKNLLCTPLLVTLLVMSYKTFQELPDQLSEFFDSIFQILLQRHDGAKPGFRRPRRCSFNDNQYRAVFEAFCYESKEKRKSIFSYNDVYRYVSTALPKINLKEDPDSFIDDIVKVTCLLLRDGDSFRFIHKSVQEYYAAAFIRHRSEPIAKKFYTHMLAERQYGPWAQELQFLSEIDKYRHNKYYYLPLQCAILGCEVSGVPTEVPKADLAAVKRYLGKVRVNVRGQTSLSAGAFSLSGTPLVGFTTLGRIFHFLNTDKLNQLIGEGKVGRRLHNTAPFGIPLREGEHYFSISVEELIDLDCNRQEFVELTQAAFEFALDEARQTLESISQEEQMDITIRTDFR